MRPDWYDSSPIKRRSMVDFPEPLGPMMASFSPGVTSRLKSSRIRTSPYDLLTPRHCTAGSSGCAKFALQVAEEKRGGITDREKDQGHHGIGLRVTVGHPGYLAGCT